ncbi:MAG: M23 family metallopeptidase [Candidatus Yanofskybacteria bacterium]|nr:M23 family metallopeptidase [Candidatus Yanofskybacteria bacterium]
MLKGESFGLWGTLVFVFMLLALKGSLGEGQPTLFSNLLKETIEETPTSLAAYTRPSAQLADISSIVSLNTDSFGQGGQEPLASIPPTINDNSILAHTPTSTDYIETSGYRRSQITEYTVQAGDLLSFIASDYGISMNSIIWANGLKNADSISPGQILKIPPVSGVIHQVKKGDTIASIAKKYAAEEAKIIEFNSISKSGELQTGDEIIVPDGELRTSVAIATSVAAKNGVRPFSYLPDMGNYFIQPTSGRNWGRIHGRNGVDVANSCGTPVYAAAEGSVSVADSSGYNGGFGKYIKIAHPNGTETLYAHSMKLLVSSGQTVSRGQQIMLMGTTGRSTGCHLHFEVHGARNLLAK